MDPIIEQIVANMTIHLRGSFRSLTECNSKLSGLKPIPCYTNCTPVSIQHMNFPGTSAQATLTPQAETEGNWNVAVILCGEGEFHLPRESYFGSSSLGGTVSGFWHLIWDSVRMAWAPKMHHHFEDWPYSAATKSARLLQLQGRCPAGSHVNTEDYPKNAALILIKNALKRWLQENTEFCVLIGGPWHSSA